MIQVDDECLCKEDAACSWQDMVFIKMSEKWVVLVDCGTHYDLSWSWLSSGEISNSGRTLVVELVDW